MVLSRERAFWSSPSRFLSASTPAGVGTGPPAQPERAPGKVSVAARVGRTLLYLRFRLLDPDRLLSRLEPKIRFFWTRIFLGASVGCVLAAFVLFCLNWHEVMRSALVG